MIKNLFLTLIFFSSSLILITIAPSIQAQSCGDVGACPFGPGILGDQQCVDLGCGANSECQSDLTCSQPDAPIDAPSSGCCLVGDSEFGSDYCASINSKHQCINHESLGGGWACESEGTYVDYCTTATGSSPSFRIPTYEDVVGFFVFDFEETSNPRIIGNITTATLKYVFPIAGLLLFAYLLYGGFHLATSFGSPKAILEAWLIIFRAFVGFILVFASFWLVRIIENIFGLTILGG